MCLCVRMSMYVHLLLCVHVSCVHISCMFENVVVCVRHVYIHLCAYTYVCAYVCVHVLCMYMCVTCTYAHKYVYSSLYVCMCVEMPMCVHVSVYVLSGMLSNSERHKNVKETDFSSNHYLKTGGDSRGFISHPLPLRKQGTRQT